MKRKIFQPKVEKDVSNVQNEHGVLVRRRAEKGFYIFVMEMFQPARKKYMLQKSKEKG
ncbi:MAG: hypothetical protein ACLUTU_03700 [Blautia faecis]